MDVREKASSKKRLIDADAFLEKMKRTRRYFDVVFDVEEMPTVDAVEVVRCKDCIYAYRIDGPREEYDCRKMSAFAKFFGPEHFCSYGERKEGAD